MRIAILIILLGIAIVFFTLRWTPKEIEVTEIPQEIEIKKAEWPDYYNDTRAKG